MYAEAVCVVRKGPVVDFLGNFGKIWTFFFGSEVGGGTAIFQPARCIDFVSF